MINLVPETIKLLHVEASSKCNAWCPACARNNNGFGLDSNLVEQDLSTSRFTEILEKLPNLETIQFCGNLGDPIAGKNILALLDAAITTGAKIQIHTNGGLRSKQWWVNLAGKLKNVPHDVWFGIDGLEGVHEIYRQGTTYKKVVDNATAFIDAGGFATWQFIPFDHNEHQVKDCLKESQRLGFKKFKFVKLFRNKTQAYHHKTGKSFILNPPKEFQQLVRLYNDKHKEVKPENCMHSSIPSIYLNANGKLSHCCYKSFQSFNNFDNLNDLLYNKADLTQKICLLSCGT